MTVAENTCWRSGWVMRVLMVAGGEYYQAPMLNADTNRENNPIYIALGHAHKHQLIHILYRKYTKMQNILDLTMNDDLDR